MTKTIITHTCIICNKEYKPLKKTSKYCSQKCFRSTPTKTVLTNCHTCKKEFKQDKAKFVVNIKNFCSRKCYQEDHKAVLHTVQCKGCGKDIELQQNRSRAKDKGQENFFCNDKCKSQRDRVLKCIACGVEFCSFEYRKANNKKGFTVIRSIKRTCSLKCHHNFYKTNKERKEKISISTSGPKHHNYINGSGSNYRVRKTDLKENFSKRDKRELFEKFNNKCFRCGDEENLTVDHNLPFSLGGRLTKSNSVILCRSCNSSKNAKHPSKFYSEKQLKKLKEYGVDHNNLFNFIF